MKFIRKVIDLVKDNFRIKLGICIFLIIVLITVVVSGVIYSNNLNSKNLALQIIKKKDSIEKDSKKEKEKTEKEKEEEKKKIELEDIKNKIRDLDETVDLSATEGDLDKDILYYENLYNELLIKKEEEEAKEEEGSTDNTYGDEIYYDPSEGVNTVKPPIVAPPSTDITIPEPPKVEEEEKVEPPVGNDESDSDKVEEGDSSENSGDIAPPDQGNQDSVNGGSQTNGDDEFQTTNDNKPVEQQ